MKFVDLALESTRNPYPGLTQKTINTIDCMDAVELRALARKLAQSGKTPVKRRLVNDRLAIIALAKCRI